jgi:polyhydroxybutyrate depolymerase
VPESYDPASPTPLVVLLHGYSATGLVQSAYMRLPADAEQHGYLLAVPEGLANGQDKQFWNATDYCCAFGVADPPDDVAYLTALLDDVARQYNVDAKRVYVIGHSNGGFMAHRLACEIGPRITAIASLAGAQWLDPAKCPAGTPVNVLQVHGTADDTIEYLGRPNAFPSAQVTVETWRQKNGCSGDFEPGAARDVDTQLAGDETEVQIAAGCPAGGAVELWTIEGGAHIPSLGDSWADQLWAWFEAHPKP